MPLVSAPKTGTLIGAEVQIEVKASFGDCQDGPLPLNSITRFQKRVWGHSLNMAIPQFLPNRRQLPCENSNAGGRFPLYRPSRCVSSNDRRDFSEESARGRTPGIGYRPGCSVRTWLRVSGCRSPGVVKQQVVEPRGHRTRRERRASEACPSFRQLRFACVFEVHLQNEGNGSTTFLKNKNKHFLLSRPTTGSDCCLRSRSLARCLPCRLIENAR